MLHYSSKPLFVQGGTTASTNPYNDNLNKNDFLSLIKDFCHIITERGDKLLEPDNDALLCEMLYYLLNFKPKVVAFQRTYDSIFEKYTQELLRMEIYKRLITSELREIYPLIKKTPIFYASPEIDIAEMHFSGAIGLDRKKPGDYRQTSYLIQKFSFDAYKQIRAASTHHELELVHSPHAKLALTHVLLGYYIDWYARLLTSVIDRAGFGIYIENSIHPETRLDSIINGLLTRDEMKAFSTNTPEVETNIKKKILENHCRKEILLYLIRFLNDLGFEYKIGYKACSKKDFAEYVWVIKEYCRVLNFTKYKPCKEALTMYYGVPPTQYKVKDCSEFLKTPAGKNLRKKIEQFCSEHEEYCYR